LSIVVLSPLHNKFLIVQRLELKQPEALNGASQAISLTTRLSPGFGIPSNPTTIARHFSRNVLF
jgi:hypothetical protein